MFCSAPRVALSLSASVFALALVSSEVRATDYFWFGSSTLFLNSNNWRDIGNNLPSPNNNTATFVTANNFIINANNSSSNPFISGTWSVGTITLSDLVLTTNNNTNLTTAGLTVNSGSQVRTRTATVLNGNITINSGGTWTAAGFTTVTGRATNAGTMTLDGWIVSGITTLTNTGTITGSDRLTAATIVNSGSITGTTYGLDLTSAANLTNSGTISGGTSAVRLGANGNTITINPGAVFTNGIDYNSTTGNTTNFGTGSYTIAVKNYNVANNTITVANPTAQTVVTSGVVATNGNVVVNQAAPATIAVVNTSSSTAAVSSPSSQTQEFGRSVSIVVGDILSQVNSGGMGGGATSSGFQPASMNAADTGGLVRNVRNEFGSEVSLPGTLNTTADMGTPRQGVFADGQGILFWSRAFAGTRYQPEVSGLPATQSNYAGAAMGYDRRVEDWRVGGFAGYGSTALNSFGGAGNVKGDLFFAGLYGRREIGAWAVDLGLTGGTIGNKSSRFINGTNGLETANAAFSGVFIAPEAAVSYAYQIDPAWTLTPTARLRYTGSFYGAYAETGSSQNITFGAQSVHMIEERAELRLGHTMKLDEGLSFNSYVQASAFGIHRLGSDVTTASVLGTDITLNSTTSKDLFGASLGAGFDWKVKKDVTLFAGADALIYSNGSNGASARAGIRVSF